MNTPNLVRGPFFRAVLCRLAGVLLLSLVPVRVDGQTGFIERKAVLSSDLASVGYDARRHTLEIEFRSGGIYRYLDVPAATHDRLLAAESKGRFFAAHIRDQFRCERVKARASAAR